MMISYLKLVNFRNYENLELNLSKGVNFLYGNNGEGKTNICEAIYYPFLCRSFRKSSNSDLVRIGEKNFYLKATFLKKEIENHIEIESVDEKRKITINNKNTRKISSLNEYSNMIYFIPEDVDLLKGTPKNRRDFIDISLSRISKKYLTILKRYQNLLKERNSILKDDNFDKKYLEVITYKMSELNYEIYNIRKRYFDKINSVLPDIYKKIFSIECELYIEYETFLNEENKEEYIKKAYKMYNQNLDKDKKDHFTNIGIHKDDFRAYFNKKDVGKYCSQGENRLVAISLKMTPYFIGEEKPIVILDDVLSELDKNNEETLLNFIKNLEQTFITSTKKREDKEFNYYKVENRNVVKENIA